MKDSTDRLAWTQTRTSEGMGSGFDVFKDKQPESRKHIPGVLGYYEGEEYKETLNVEGMSR
jgi:hypothetical protein